MEITGKEMQDITGNLSRIASNPVPQINALQFKLGYRVKRILDAMQSALQDLDKRRILIVKKYGVEDKVKKTTNVPDENMGEFTKEYDLLFSEKVTIDIELIPLELLQSSGMRINLIELAAIESLIAKPKEV